MDRQFNLEVKCPKCAKKDCRRVVRKGWVRVIPFSKRYRCRDCSCEFIVVGKLRVACNRK